MMTILGPAAIIARVFAGLIFTFSGFVKAVDPLGSTYKFIDYFHAFHITWLDPAALPLAILLSTCEFLIGICLLLFMQNKWANWGALLFMAFFTPLTLWLALTNPVHDCGCFGDALVLTNWQTFYKNIIISGLVVISFIHRTTLIRWLKPRNEWLIFLVVALLITGFSLYNYQHLPLLDFRPYKVGTYIPAKMVIPEGAPADVYEQYMTLRDTASGKEISIESATYINDSMYWCKGTKWMFISSSKPRLVKRGYHAPIHDFSIVSAAGADVTQTVLSDTGYYFLLVAYDLKTSQTRDQPKINELYSKVRNDQHKFICLTSSNDNDIANFKSRWNVTYQYFLTDPITLKTMIRANPGLVLLHKGTILGKWNAKDIPAYETIKAGFIFRKFNAQHLY